MYRSLLVPLDGSRFGEHALPLALTIARRAGCSIHLVRVHVPFTPLSADSLSPFSYEVEVKVMEQERAYLDGVMKQLANVSTVPVTTALLEGPVAETMQEYALTSGADLIVMTTHGYGPLSRFWLGSVADEMMRRATAPVLLVRPHEEPLDLVSEPALHHILIPLDGSLQAEQAIACANTLGTVMQSEYTLLRVYGADIDAVSLSAVAQSERESGTEQLRRHAEDYLNRVAGHLQQQGHTVQTQAVQGRHPASVILDTALSRPVDLIALETHGHRGLRRLFLGSVADKVIRGASMPILVHRSPGK